MILAGLSLLAVGGADLIRQFLPSKRRWMVQVAAALVLFLVASGFDAAVWAFIAIAVAAIWVFVVPSDGSGRAGFWPVAGLAVLCAAAVSTIGLREATGPLGDVWRISGPNGVVHPDAAILLVGAIAFLLESGNVIVRTALREEAVADENDDEGEPGLKGGRLIGPLERVLVFALTLAGAYTLLAAVLAAKGIVRFPEISRDTATGNRAEYFLVGSLVSWVAALASALLVWWAFTTLL
ncbi:hypothetical protein [Microbacterium sp.]|uniref:hypothetical protein n=1 Tax=Microbacterium sp. TaxID=51671 RepID=UPI002D7A188C|nr:hypothetical protein [Microbacterium sp.]HET6301549.1 hypothetical protein [Microbacterium sp.]